MKSHPFLILGWIVGLVLTLAVGCGSQDSGTGQSPPSSSSGANGTNPSGNSSTSPSTSPSNDPNHNSGGIDDPSGKTEFHLKFDQIGLTAVVTPVQVRSKAHSSFTIHFWPSTSVKVGSPVHPGYRVQGRTWMDMDNGSHHPGGPGQVAETSEPGVYTWNKVGFTMASKGGTWFIYLALYQDEKKIEEVGSTIHVP